MKLIDKIASWLNGDSNVYSIDISVLSQIWLRYNSDFVEVASSTANEDSKDPDVIDEKSFGLKEDKDNDMGDIPKNNGKIDIATLYDPLIEVINSRFSVCFEPYKDLLATIINIIDKYGNGPSVVGYQKDVDNIEYTNSTFSVLQTVSLKEHLVNTAISITKIVEKKYDPNTPLLPMFVFAALLHDIGKSKEVRAAGAYSTSDHPIVSADYASKLIPDDIVLYPWKDELVNTILGHHDAACRDNNVMVLKEADAYARQIELSSKTKKVITENDWFDVIEFVQQYVLPSVNIVDDTRRWKAITYKGYIYIEAKNLYTLVERYLEDKNITDVRFIRKAFYNQAMEYVLQRMYDLGFIKEKHIKNYKVIFANKVYQLALIEISINKVGVLPSELEKRKSPELSLIKITN